MNPLLAKLQPYPFERLRQLFAGVTPNPDSPISLGIGEPKHPTPAFIKDALAAAWRAAAIRDRRRPAAAPVLHRLAAARYGLALDPATQVLPVNGSREALFALAQTVVDASATPAPVVLSPNPFYQIYEGAALLAGAEPYYVPSVPARNFAVDWDSVPAEVWAAHATGVRLLARQPDRRRDAAGRMAEALRAVGPPRLRDRGRRVLQRDLLPRRAAAGRPGGRGQARAAATSAT